MKTYHKIILTALILLFQIGTAWGDEVDRRLPVDTPQEIKQSTREVILSGVDSDRTLEVTRAMLQQNFDRRQVSRVHALLLKSQGDGENVNALINKVAEGIAKRVPPTGILGALEKVQSRQDFAATTVRLLKLREHQADRLSLLVSSGLAAGLSQDDTDAIMQAVRQRTALLNADQAYALASATFEIARDASRLGVSSQSTAELVNSALRMGFNHDQMSAMHQSFLSQSQQASPESLAHGYAAAIQQSQGVQGLNAVQGTPPGAMGPSTGGAEGAGGFGGSGGGGSGSGGGSGGGGGGSGGGGGGSGGSGGNR